MPPEDRTPGALVEYPVLLKLFSDFRSEMAGAVGEIRGLVQGAARQSSLDALRTEMTAAHQGMTKRIDLAHGRLDDLEGRERTEEAVLLARSTRWKRIGYMLGLGAGWATAIGTLIALHP